MMEYELIQVLERIAEALEDNYLIYVDISNDLGAIDQSIKHLESTLGEIQAQNIDRK